MPLPTAIPPVPEPNSLTEHSGWTPEELEALQKSAFWFSLEAPRELLAQYKGMHVAVLGEQIVDADVDKNALFGRIDADPERFPPNRVLPRYIPTDEESFLYRY